MWNHWICGQEAGSADSFGWIEAAGYRGYDSAGVALIEGEAIGMRKCKGRIQCLSDLIAEVPVSGCIGISHTRWATHGSPTDANAHPHSDRSGRLILVHNGVIENYRTIGDRLAAQGHEFRSETDSEVLAHLMGKLYDESPLAHSPKRLVSAVRSALAEVKGTYGIAVMHLDVPDLIVGARLGSPLVIGLGKGEHFISSDVGAMVAHTRDAVYLNDYDLVMLTASGFEILSPDGGAADFEVSQVDFTQDDADKGDYPHYMLKEIFEQPESLKNAMRGRLCLEDGTAKLGGLDDDPAGTACDRPDRALGLWHRISRGDGGRVPDRRDVTAPGRGRDRERIPLPQHADLAQHPVLCA